MLTTCPGLHSTAVWLGFSQVGKTYCDRLSSKLNHRGLLRIAVCACVCVFHLQTDTWKHFSACEKAFSYFAR